MYSKVKGQSLFQVILCREEEMPIQTDRRFCPCISSTPHRMAWNILWVGTLQYTFCVGYLAPWQVAVTLFFRQLEIGSL